MSKKHVEITTTLPKDCEGVIGIPVKSGENVVGEVVEYDKESGKATIKIDYTAWEKIAGEDKGLLEMFKNKKTRKKTQ